MHDPMTVAWELKRPWPHKTTMKLHGKPWRYYPAVFTIWHRDPERDGSDDSCRWYVPSRPWFLHPRWHVHHWRMQWHFGQALRRWVFSRCSACGQRFRWGYSPVTTQWHSPKRRLWQGESCVYHEACCPPLRSVEP